MLQSIRDHSQGWLAWTIISIICVTFAFWGIHNYLGGSSDTGVLATVNGQPIQKVQVDSAYERLRRQQQMQLGAEFSINSAVEAQLKKQALNEIIMSHVLSNAALSEGYRVTDDQVRNALARMPVFQVDGQFSPQRFQEILTTLSYSDAGFFNDLRTTMTINQTQSGIVDSAFTLPDDVQNSIKLIDQKRDIAYLIIPMSHFMHDLHIDDSEVQAYYKKHESQFATPERVSVEYVELSLPAIAAKFHFDDAKLQQFYKDNLDNYTKAARFHVARILIKLPENPSKKEFTDAQAKIQNILNRLKRGEDFASLAQQYSEDSATAKHGGVMDWFAQNEVDSSLARVLPNLKQVGDTSDQFRTKDGLAIIKLLSLEKPQVQPFAKVRLEVEKALGRQQAAQKFAEQSDKLANLSYVHPTSLTDVAKELGLTVNTTEVFDRQGSKSGITANPKITAAAFNPEVLNRGNNSDVVELSSDSLVVLRINKHESASVKPLNEVQNVIRDVLKTEIAQKKTHELGKVILQRLQQGISGKTLATEYSLNWLYKPDVGRYDSTLNTAILAQAFRMPHPDKPNSFTSAGMPMPSGGYAVIAVTGVHEGNSNIPEAKRRIFREQIENNLGQIDYELYVRGLLKSAKIVFKDQMLTPSS